MGIALNIGCGEKTVESISGHKCINVDIRALEKIDVRCNVKNLPFKNESFERISASDIIEHFPLSDTEKLLAEWARVLAIGGHMKIKTPSLKWMVACYLQKKDAKFVSYHIFGGQTYSENFHYVIFDQKWLSSICDKYGLKTIEYREIYSNFEIVVVKEK